MSIHPHHVMVTRPAPAGAVLCAKLLTVGLQPIYFPTLVFAPPADAGLMKKQLKKLDRYAWLIFISPQAVHASHAAIQAQWPEFPANVNIAAVGAGTAEALQAVNLPVTVYPEVEWSSKGLLELPEFQAVTGKKIAIVRGEGGREWLAENLAARGASVAHIIVYRRMLPDVDVTDYVGLLHARKIDRIVCTSGEGLRNLKTLLPAAWSELQDVSLIVISERMRALATELGFKKIFLAKNASHSAIMDALLSLSATASQDEKGLPMENQADNSAPVVSSDAATHVHPQAASAWWVNMVNIGILCSAFAFVVLIAGFYLGYTRILDNNQYLAGLAASLDSKVIQDQADIAALQKAVTESAQNVQAALTNQQHAISEMRSVAAGKKESFHVAEAAYLTHLANDNLQIGDNVPLVISLLQTADQKLKDLDDANVLPIRKALAADIAALQAVPVVDLAGVYARLTALNKQVDQLPLPNKRPPVEQTASSDTEDQKLSWWRRGLHQTWNALQKIVVVRYNKPGERPFIPPEQQDFLYQNLHATLEQALSAVVQRQQEIYRASLQQTAAWIQQYFLADSPVTQAEMSALTELQAVALRPELPTISASLQAFHDYSAENDTAGKPTETPANQS